MQFTDIVNFNKNLLVAARIENLGTLPSSPAVGQLVVDTTGGFNILKVWNGTVWVSLFLRWEQMGAPTADVDMGSQKLINVADPTAAQHAATRAYVLARKITDLTAPTSDVSFNGQKLTSLGTPTTGTDGATKAYVDSVGDSARQGISVKMPVKAAATTNVTLSAPGATIDGVTMVAGDRFLASAQSTGAEKGIYIWNGAAVAATRSDDADVYTEVQDGTQVFVQQGTDAEKVYRQTATIASFTGQTWAIASSGTTYTAGTGLTETPAGTFIVDTAIHPRKYSAAIGNGSDTTITVTHNLGTRDVITSVVEAATPWEHVLSTPKSATTNTVTFQFSTAPTSGQYRITILG